MHISCLIWRGWGVFDLTKIHFCLKTFCFCMNKKIAAVNIVFSLHPNIQRHVV